MALAIDASTPTAAVNSNNSVATVTSPSFTPPAGSLIWTGWAANSATATNPGSPSITDNLGAHLTYALLDWQSRANSPTVEGQAADWSAVVGSSAAMTITVTTGAAAGSQVAIVAPVVLTGQHATPIGAHGKSGSVSAAAIAQSYTGTASGSWGFIVVLDWDALGSMSAGTGCTLIATGTVAGQVSYGFFRRTTADGTNGGTTTLNVTIPGTSTHLSWAYAEIIPAAGAATGTTYGPVVARAVGQVGQGAALLTRPTSDPPPPGLLPLVVVAAPMRASTPVGSVGLVRVFSTPYLDPPSPRPDVVSPAIAPTGVGVATVLGSRTDPGVVPDFPPAPVVVGGDRAVSPTLWGAAVLTRSTADPDFPPAPEPFTVRAGTARVPAGPAVVLRAVADPAVTDTPPVTEPFTVRAGLAMAPPGGVLVLRPVAEPADVPGVPEVVMVRSAAWPPPAAPAATLTASRADTLTDTRTGTVVTAQTRSGGRAGAVLLTRPTADPAQATRPTTFTVGAGVGRIRIGTAELLAASGGGLVIATGPGYLSGPDTSGNPLAGLDVGAFTFGDGADRNTTLLVGQSGREWTLDSTGDRAAGGMI